MTEQSREHNFEFALFGLAFILALALRLFRLDVLPMGDVEASWALQALNLSKGLRPEIGAQPAYVIFTGLLFYILPVTNFTARLVPAISGALLCLIPFLFKDKLGIKVSVILAFFLALDPGFLALSRTAGSPILALAAFLFALGYIYRGQSAQAGVLLGIALLSGPILWPGLIGLGLAASLQKGLFSKNLSGDNQTPAPILHAHGTLKKWTTIALSAAGTYVLLGSLFFLVPGSLGSGLDSIPAYLKSWVNVSDVPITRLILGLVFYEILALVLALIGLVRGIIQRDRLVIFLGFWLLTSAILAIANPSRTTADLIWLLVPLLTLAAQEVSRNMLPVLDGALETIGMMVFTVAILVFSYINYSAIALTSMDQVAFQLRVWVLIGAVSLLAISIVLIAFGWSFPVAFQGSTWGVFLVLFFYTISTAMAAGELRSYQTLELWHSGPYAGQVQVMTRQLDDLSRWKTGVAKSLDVTLAEIDSPAILWALRDWQVKTIPDANLSDQTPSIVIAPDQFTSTEIESSYRGKDWILSTNPAWNQGLISDWLRWSVLHVFPQSNEKIIMWVRSDLFLDFQNNR